MSTKPGVTSRPVASIVRSASPVTTPTSVIVPPSIATSAVRAGVPVPSTTVPPRMMMSYFAMRMSLGCSVLQGREQLTRQELLRSGTVLAVGTEARAGDHETIETERRKLTHARRAAIRCADDREAVDEFRIERRGLRRLVAQVLVAVVSAADLGHDGAVGVGQTGARRARHRREVRERGDGTADETARRVDVVVTADVHVRAERDLAGIAARVGRGLARDVEGPRDPVGI